MPTKTFDLLPIVTSPRGARAMLGGVSLEKLYRLLNDRTLESYRDGRRRFITTESIRAYVAAKLAEAEGATPATAPAATPPRRGRSSRP
jgi:excisionase family DNA binding protein